MEIQSTKTNNDHEMTKFQKLREEERAVRRAVQERLSTALTGAFGLVAALAWNDAVKSLIDYFYPASGGADLGPKFLYAVVVTLIVSIAVYLVSKFLTKKEEEKKA